MRDKLESPPISPRLRWLETLGSGVIELQRLTTQARILEAANPGKPEVFHGFEYDFFERMNDLICGNLGWETTHNADLPLRRDGDRFVYIGNHPTLTVAWPWGYFMSRHFASNTVAVAKHSIIKNPLSRWAMGDLMLRAHKGIFINRDDRDQAMNTIEAETQAVLTPDTGAVFFPDAHRPYKRRIAKQVKDLGKAHPELQIGSWMTETCFPKSGGLWALMQSIRDLIDVRFLDCTIVEPVPTHTYGARLHFDVQEVSREELLGTPESIEHLNGALVNLWKRKNRMIKDMRRL
ncbi:1-acyl-sn-glycerol-3-phosphate acyltransferase [Candidatus Peregrinibacteria bacterium]|nr:1-acyl-sn-glycerol-3-phosphate acyltransferase [Candidatus Peregrinibacteria bacterium]